MAFFQDPPRLTDPWRADRALREHLERLVPPELLAEAEPALAAMGAAACGELLALAAQAESEPPQLVSYDPWGNRIDHIRVSPAWDALHAVQVRAGICALPYEPHFGEHARIVQHALLHLYGPSSATYTCPIAMTDAAARVLTDHAPAALRERVVPRLTSRDVASAWTSGQWMTEREGGSDVRRTATVAQRGDDGVWRLHGTKWFTSATTADCALALARPAGAAEGSRGLALFLVERVDPHSGASQVGRTILVNRLKDKLGTKSLPTAELTLAGAVATPVGEPVEGLKKISGMLNVTRAHNAMGAAGGMRRGVDLAVAYARVREAFGRPLLELPLHRETLAALAVEAEAAFALTLRLQHVLGRVETRAASDHERALLRGLTPLAKLLTGKGAVAVTSEALEAFGGAGYIEDTGLPALLRNAQVLPIWEGTTNVLSLDLLRAAATHDAVNAVLADVGERMAGADDPQLDRPVRLVATVRDALIERARTWADADGGDVAAGMRGYALALARCYTAAVLCEHAAYRLAKHNDARAAAVARRYAQRWLTRPLPEPGDGAESLSLLRAEAD
jgi:acyl-CoA dehydrogenase